MRKALRPERAARTRRLTSARPAWAICEPQEGQRLTLDAAHRFMQNPAPLLRQQMSSYSLSVFIMQYAATHSRDLDVLKLILREGLLLGLVGTFPGAGGAFVLTRLLSSVLFRVSPADDAARAKVLDEMERALNSHRLASHPDDG